MTVADEAAAALVVERYLAVVENDDYSRFGELLSKHPVSTAGQAVRRRLTGGRRDHCSAK